MTHTIHHGDCLEVLRQMPDNSVDAVVCDPPYGLSNTSPDKVTETIVRWAQGDREYVPTGKGFMGASWDAFVPPVAVWDECLRVLKPGGHLVAFAGSRTQDLMGLAIRLAGFDIRENLAWLYGSGFPKSLDAGKAIDKMAPRVGMFDDFAAHFKERRVSSGLTQKAVAQHFPSKTGGLTGCVWNWENGANVPTRTQWDILAPMLELSNDWLPLIERVEAEREVIRTETRMNEPSGIVNIGQGKRTQIERKITAPSTDEAQKWQGWGTALKPAHEPIILARKPFQGTVAANTLTWGTGGLNIDATRIGTTGGTRATNLGELRGTMYDRGKGKPTNDIESINKGRWPANVVLDPDTAKVLDQQSGTLRPGERPASKGITSTPGANGTMGGGWSGSKQEKREVLDSGGASRFFKIAHWEDHECSSAQTAATDTTTRTGSTSTGVERTTSAKTVEPDPPFMYAAKAPKRERPSYTTEDGQTVQHATVKPLSIMQWLVKLVTPEGGTVLDPFAGSGTTVEAALLEGFNVIGIEREAEYLPLIQQRIDRANDVLPIAS